MGYSNINATPNYQLQGFGQSGMRTISTSQAYVEGEYYRVLVATQDSTISATSVIGDDITGLQVYAGTTIYGLFTAVSVSVGEVTAYLAGATDIDSVWSYINTYGLNNGATIEAADCAKDAIEPLLDKYYAQASLVLVPSLYKTSIVYAERPLDANGQLTFTRASEATRVGPDGYVEKVRTNLVPNGLLFIASTGVLYTTITSDTPISGVSSTRITKNEAAGTLRYANQNCSASALTGSISYTISRYFKYDGYNLTTSMEFNNSAQWGGVSWIQNIDIASTGITLQSPSNCTSKITNVGNGWYRVDVTIATGASPAGSPVTYLLKVGSTLATDQGFLTAAPQFETGDIATNYIPTTTAAVSVGPVSNLPRLNYPINADGSVGCPSLLLEPQRTNVCLWSEQINNAGWTKGNSPTITTNIATAPDGYSGADGIQAQDALNYKSIAQTLSVSANSTLTLSFFVKKETIETAFGGFYIYFQGATPKIVYGIVNAVTGTVTYASSTLTPTTKVESYGNYWRIASTATDTGSNTLCEIGYYGTLSANGTSISPAVGSVRTLWGFQAEIGAYATSYIPTLATSVTRVADACSKTGISSLYGATEGVVYLETGACFNNGDTAATKNFIRVEKDANNWFGIGSGGLSAAPTLRIVTNIAGTTTTEGEPAVLSNSKIAFLYTSSSIKVYQNGALVLTVNKSIGNYAAVYFMVNSADDMTMPLKQFLIFPTALTDAQAIELTSL